MPRHVKPRVSYDHDATTIRRMRLAVLDDPNRPESWKQKLAAHLAEALEMMMADAIKLLNADSAGAATYAKPARRAR